jgi:Asp-tRNA(Asn)/Glu-tRNA(Gln) amidotransferase A subunit family amidase
MTDTVPPYRLTATEASAHIAAGKLGVEDLARSCLERVAAREPAVRAWSFLDPAQVLRDARELDKMPRIGPLHGIPIGVKDVFDTRDMPTTHNSPLFVGHRPGQDAGCVATLRAAGALIFGKTDTSEFAAGGRWAATGNPANPAHTSGGSSSGSAAAVPDFHVPLALGTQTGGSLIRPASFCGVFALKPTWGVVSREGSKLYSLTLDTVGWYGRSVADLRLMAEVFELLKPPAEPPPPVPGLRIAVCQTSAWEFAEPETRDAMALAVERLARAGATVSTLELPSEFDLLPTRHHKAVLHGEGRAAFLNLRLQYGERFHPELRSRADNAEGFTPAQITEAWDTAARCRPMFDALAGQYHAVLTPSSCGTAPVGRWPGNPVFNQMWTLLHAPCVNVPCSTAGNGMPIGLTLAGPRFSDFALLDVAERVAPVLQPAS